MAFRESAAFLGFPLGWHLAFSAASWILAALMLRYVFAQAGQVTEELRWVISLTGAALSVFLLVFVAHMLLIPARLSEESNRLSQLERKDSTSARLVAEELISKAHVGNMMEFNLGWLLLKLQDAFAVGLSGDVFSQRTSSLGIGPHSPESLLGTLITRGILESGPIVARPDGGWRTFYRSTPFGHEVEHELHQLQPPEPRNVFLSAIEGTAL
jgi:hypothetical protein